MNWLTAVFRMLSTLGIPKAYSHAVVIATYQRVVNDKGPNEIRGFAVVHDESLSKYYSKQAQ